MHELQEDNGVQLMSKRKPRPSGRNVGGPAGGGEEKRESVTVKCSAEWKDWIDAFAEDTCRTPPDLIAYALKELAKAMKFRQPPKR